ncbi:MAG TPA: phage tail sheath subtilisin-like domain-containing protein, partial [Caldilineaceae bacterium]|nr:phage tail sheath subtilisin-like domain-containing protein [Caldilineaceae bacterium]
MYTTPGVYFEQVDRGRPLIGPLRTDIAAFVGYTERGPLLQPVKVTSWRQFLGVFGNPLAFAHLPYAVQGFFANGGSACYIVRIADRAAEVGAAEAAALVNDQTSAPLLRFFASHGQLFDPVTQGPQMQDGQPLRVASPGTWGNRLALSLYEGGLGRSDTVPMAGAADGAMTAVTNLSGFEVGSLVRISQGDVVALRLRSVVEIDAVRRQITWSQPINDPGIDLTLPVRLETVEFSLQLLLDGQIVERHENLSLAPQHSRFVTTVLQANSLWIDVQALLASGEIVPAAPDSAAAQQFASAALDPLRWPAPFERLPFSGGRDGLATIDKNDFLAGLATFEGVDEVSILAAPDAVLNVAAPAAAGESPAQPANCAELNPPNGKLAGVVLDASRDEDRPLAGVTVVAPGTLAASQTTGADGRFLLTTLPVGLVTLRLQKAGFSALETTAEARVNLAAEPVRFLLSTLSTPPALPIDDVAEIHNAMMLQGLRGLYRVALLDPPGEALGFEAIQTWRARFDSTYGALYYPWLLISATDGQLRALPPSGHVAGLIARTDLTQGVHRAPANAVLDGVKAVSDGVDDAQQGILNPLGVNCIRVLPGRGIRVYGARTVSSDAEWRYLNVRRLLLMIEEAIEDANQWTVFEPNNPVLRQTLTHSLNSFLNLLWRQGALVGDNPQAAYQVKCTDENNPPAVVDVGQLVA